MFYQLEIKLHGVSKYYEAYNILIESYYYIIKLYNYNIVKVSWWAAGGVRDEVRGKNKLIYLIVEGKSSNISSHIQMFPFF